MFSKLNKKFKDNINKPLLTFLICLYVLILIWTIIFHLSGYAGLNTYYHALKENYSIPYRFGINRVYDFDFSSWFFWSDILINVFLFIPAGSLIMFDSFQNKSLIKLILLGLFSSLTFEIIQVFTRLGSFSYFDILSNLIGTMLGYFLFSFIKKHCKPLVINYSVLILIIIFIPVILFGAISLGINRDKFSIFFDFEKYPYIR